MIEESALRSVCSPTVRIIAFQAIDPGSTPGRRTFLVVETELFPLVFLHWERQHFNRVTTALNIEFMEIFFVHSKVEVMNTVCNGSAPYGEFKVQSINS